jgi:hypothetical protein
VDSFCAALKTIHELHEMAGYSFFAALLVFNRDLKTFSPPDSPLRFAVFIAGTDGELVLGLLASAATCWDDLSANILLALLRRPRSAGVSALALRF